MSPSWRDQVRLFLSPGRIVAVRLSRGLRPVLVARQVVSFDAAGDAHAAVLAALPGLLRDAPWQKADAVVLLSSRFARYQLLPWTDAVLSRQEEAARARRLYLLSDGEAAAALEPRTSAGGFGAASVVSGVDRELLAGLRNAFASSSLRLVSVQPYLMAAFNGCRAQLRRGAHWFAVVESGTLCSALIDGGQWAGLRTRRIAGAWQDELLLALHRQALAAGVADRVRSVVIHAADEEQAQWPAQPGWTFRQVDLTGADSRAYGLAMAGAS